MSKKKRIEEIGLFEEARLVLKSGAIHRLRELIEENAELVHLRDIPDNRGIQNTLLHEITGMGDLQWPENAGEIAELLLAKGAAPDVGESEHGGETPLHHAVSVNNVEVAEVLLKNGADPERTGRYDGTIDTALGYALFYSVDKRLPVYFRNCPELLIEYGARIYLPFAAALGDTTLLKEAFHENGELKEDKSRGKDEAATLQQALMFACRKGQVKSAEFLLQKGADPNKKMSFFSYEATPLHLASEQNDQVELVQTLLGFGAKTKIKDGIYNATAEGWAMFCGQEKVYKLLRKL